MLTIVKNVFGILISRFKIFQENIKFTPNKVLKTVMACCHLHNYLAKKRTRFYIQRGDVHYENADIGTFEQGSWRHDIKQVTDPHGQTELSS